MRYRKFALLLSCGAAWLLPSLAAAQISALPGTPPAPSATPPAPVTVQPLPATPGVPPPPAARWTTAQIREAFDLADSNSNGELTRAESQQLRILPRSFEDMDQNKNGVLERSEYESGVFR